MKKFFKHIVRILIIYLLVGMLNGGLEAADDYFVYLPIIKAPPSEAENCFKENAGILTFEIESFPPSDDWVAETNAAGFLGTSYYRWNGDNFFNTPGNGLLNYVLDIEQAGDYRMRIRNRHDHPTPDQENDVFVRLDNGDWRKLFSPNLSGCGVGIWTWCSAFDFGNANLDFDPKYNLSSGQHHFDLSARSTNFKIDRVAFYLEGEDGTNEANPVSENCRIE